MMKKNIVAACVITLLALCIYSCNDQDSSSTPAAEQTTEIKSEDTVSNKSKIDSQAIQTEAPKIIEEKKVKIDTSSAKGSAKQSAIKTDQPKADLIDQSAIDEGKELIAKSDCHTCHRLQDKLVAPSYADVATKYSYSKSTVQNLASKIIGGGTGVWGQVPMTPHPIITSAAAQKMVTYILSLKIIDSQGHNKFLKN